MNPTRQWIAALGLAALAMLAPVQQAAAVTATTTFVVSASVLSFCGVAATPLAFGNYSGAQLDGSSTLTVTCTAGTTYTVGLNGGTSAGGTITTRHMVRTSGSELLNYTLYNDSGRSTNWGDTTPTNAVGGTGTGLAQPITVYGRIAASQLTAPVGAYTDTITVTVSY